MTRISYRDGYKYQLHATYTCEVAICDETEIVTRYIDLTPDGRLTIRAGYAWDGPSGPTIDTKNFMRGSLVHDALYQLMREGCLEAGRWRKVADQELVRLCAEDGMWAIRRAWVYAGVRFGGGLAASKNAPAVLTAP